MQTKLLAGSIVLVVLMAACGQSPTAELPTQAPVESTATQEPAEPTSEPQPESAGPAPVLQAIADQRVLFSSDESGDDELYAANPDGSQRVQVTNNPESSDRCPEWSPDGSQYAYLSQHEDDQWGAIVVGNLDGSISAVVELPLNNDIGFCATWSPRGEWVLVNKIDGIYIFQPDGSELRGYSVFMPSQVSWIPGGESFAYSSAEGLVAASVDGSSEFVAMPVGWTMMAGGGFSSLDGRRFIFEEDNGLYWIDKDADAPEGEPAEESEDELFMGFATEPGAYDITPDDAPRFLRFEWLPDDTVLATGIDDADRVSLYQFHIIGGGLVDLTPGFDLDGFALSPAKTWVALIEDGQVSLMELATQEIFAIALVTELEDEFDLVRWSPDADFLLIQDDSALTAVVDLNRASYAMLGKAGGGAAIR